MPDRAANAGGKSAGSSSYVSSAPPAHDPRAAAFIADMAERWRRGERPTAEEYLAQHPDVASLPEAAIDLIYEEVCLRQDAGETVDEKEIYRRFPQWRTELEVLLRCDRILTAVAPTPQFPVVGEVMGEYHLTAELGRGAQGRVYLATQRSLADRPMVLKITPPDGREHLTLARLQHTHIVPLYTVQDDAIRHLRMICMPFLGGITLGQMLERVTSRSSQPGSGRQITAALNEKKQTGEDHLQSTSVRCPARSLLESLSYIQAVCWIGACLADALEYAHERDLVHLDLKPSNVLLAADGQPMLLDFHLAQRL